MCELKLPEKCEGFHSQKKQSAYNSRMDMTKTQNGLENRISGDVLDVLVRPSPFVSLFSSLFHVFVIVQYDAQTVNYITLVFSLVILSCCTVY